MTTYLGLLANYPLLRELSKPGDRNAFVSEWGQGPRGVNLGLVGLQEGVIKRGERGGPGTRAGLCLWVGDPG